MKCVILAGGSGKRFSEQTVYMPKPMIEVCGKPIILHIMDTYIKYNVSEFIICAGYKYKIIDEYFKNKLNIKYYKKYENIKINVVNTGLKTMTAGRIKKLKNILIMMKIFYSHMEMVYVILIFIILKEFTIEITIL